MAIVRVQHIDAFSKVPGKGNPAAVVLSGEQWLQSMRSFKQEC
ncbi:putative PhzF superfamily epimerase YddE/YHI9 [Alkalihalobacillus xiaoxiensis]|uniref:PhzF superfamily epimerase YddE/YHI9 n=1 Tax=Shouchella xiaoxiensis TaxID=766895 RepID=A0ABS2SW71_9BACI|nr:putative PhzF superfamily epimerase YddE/YHI9 [Shouchella xiaoxiensis]